MAWVLKGNIRGPTGETGPAGADGADGAPGVVQSVVGTASQVDVDSSDPANPVVSLDAAVLSLLALAGGSVQPGDNVSDLVNDVGYITGLSGFDTGDLAEGANLYFTNERAQDAVGGALTDSTTIGFTYSDVGNTITAAVIQSFAYTWTNNHSWDDSHAIRLGTGNDLQLSHDGTNSLITNSTGALKITGSASQEFRLGTGNISAAVAELFGGALTISGATPGLYFYETDVGADLAIWRQFSNGSIWTLATRTDANGLGQNAIAISRTTTSVTNFDFGNATGNPNYNFLGTGHVDLPSDNCELRLGAGPDLRLFHDGTNSKIRNDTGILYINMAGTDTVQFKGATGPFIIAGNGVDNSAAGLFAGATTAVRLGGVSSGATLEGVDQTGFGSYQILRIGGSQLDFAISGTVKMKLVPTTFNLQLTSDNQELQLGASQDLRFYHDGTNSLIRNDTGELRFNMNGTTVGWRITQDGRLYATNAHNNAGAVTGATNQYVASGTYTPTLTNVTNVAASTARQCQWVRVGNVVTVSGQCDVDPTAAAATELGISLPIASALTTAFQCGGSAAPPLVADDGAAIDADATNDRARMRWVATDVTNHAMTFIFSYEVL